MKFIQVVLLSAILTLKASYAQTIWNGPKITFTKANNADWTLPENQDRITDSIWITRQFNEGVFNLAKESAYKFNESPIGTLWSFGTTDSLSKLTFRSWQEAVVNRPPEMIGKPMVVHLLKEDVYIDITFLSWQRASAGGGFSYERSTNPTVGINSETKKISCSIFPNPAKDFIMLKVNGITEQNSRFDFVVYDMYGKQVYQESVYFDPVNSSKKIHNLNLVSGAYLVQLRNDREVTSKNIVIL